MKGEKQWFGIDGIDCTGKTSVLHALQSDGTFISDSNAITFEEFTTSGAGDALREIISERRFLSLSDPPHTRWADTHLLVSDWSYKVEIFAHSKFRVAVSDRTHLSIMGYQIARLEIQYPNLDIPGTEQTLSSAIHAVRSSNQNVTFSDILLTVDADELQRRLVTRGEDPLKMDEVEFLMRAQNRQKEYGASRIINTTDMQLAEVLHEVRSVILRG